MNTVVKRSVDFVWNATKDGLKFFLFSFVVSIALVVIFHFLPGSWQASIKDTGESISTYMQSEDFAKSEKTFRYAFYKTVFIAMTWLLLFIANLFTLCFVKISLLKLFSINNISKNGANAIYAVELFLSLVIATLIMNYSPIIFYIEKLISLIVR